MGAITLTGITADYGLPGNYIEVNFAQGSAGGSALDYPVLLMGNKLSTGDATVDSVVYGGPTSPLPLETEQDWIDRFGRGSELHRMWRRFVAINKTTAIYAIAVTQSAGTAAAQTVTYVNAATAAGTARVYVGDEFVEVAIASGDAIATMATATRDAINAKVNWPVTATAANGVVTVTARQNGPRGNDITIAARITPGITTTIAAGAAKLAGGATADDNTTALATISSRRFYYIVSAAYDATQFGALVTQVNTMALPATGIRQRAIAGSVDSQANAITVATGRNSARAEYVHLQNADWTPAELAAHAAAAYTATETKPNPRKNFDGFGNDAATQALWLVPAPRDGTTPSPTALNNGIKNGLTPIGVNATGSTYIAMRCTTRCLNGANPDYRIRDAHKVTICDYFADDWQAILAQRFSGKAIADDPPRGGRPPGRNVATPSVVRAALYELINDYDSNDNLQNVAQIKADSIVQRETSPSTRMSVRVPLQPIDALHQTVSAIDQVA